MKDVVRVDRVIPGFSTLSSASIHASPRHLPISQEAAAKSAPRLCRHVRRDTERSVKKKKMRTLVEDHTHNHDVLVSG